MKAWTTAVRAWVLPVADVFNHHGAATGGAG
jgi:hypothetical protein